MRRSSRGDVDPFIVMDVLAQARALEAAGRSIIHMEIGQPGTGAPAGARHALQAALAGNPMGYTVGLGLPELRARIARHYQDWYGVTLNPDRVVITTGSSSAFILAFSALFDAGDTVGIGEPGYPSYRQILRAMSLPVVGIPTHAEQRYQLTPELLADHDLKGLLIASPGNPTGTMIAREEMRALIEHCAIHDISLISDEIYHGLHYDQRAISALELTDDVYVINSFSKYFGMTGWRIGWMVVPEAHVRTVERLAQNLFICAPHVSQLAALAAMECQDELELNRDVYAQNRQVLLDGLPKAGFINFSSPEGAFYVYADVRDITDDSLALASEILNEAGVAVTPGIDFDPHRGKGTLRFSYAGSAQDVAEGMRRLTDYMTQRKQRGANGQNK
jgi:aspartate/methionine/tyrosine aminotransferase